MIDTFVFDLDGTLLDTLSDLSNSVNFALRRHSLPEHSYAEIRQMLGNGVRRLVREAVPEGTDDVTYEAVFADFRRHYMDHCLDATAPFPGMLHVLETLRRRGVKMAIVSNKLDPAVQELNRHFFAQYIEVAVGESATVRRKPCPDAVLSALERLGSERGRALYVGDSEVDIATARAAGMRVAVALWGFRDECQLRPLAAEDTLFVSRPEELLDIPLST